MNNDYCHLVIDYFNGALSDEERMQFEQHLKECHSCQEELRELQEVVGDLAFLAEPKSPPSDMKARVLANVFAEEQEKPVQSVDRSEEVKKPSVVEKPRPVKRRGQARWLMPLLAAGLLLSLIGNGYAVVNWDKENESAEPLRATSTDSISKTLSLQAASTKPATATASMVNTTNNSTNMVIQAQGLSSLKGNEVYQVWLIKDNKPQPAGSFVTDSQGNGVMVYTLKPQEAKKKWDTIAITLENQPNRKLPQGDIVLSSKYD
ncbi:anti-sigma factor [Priestia koreensis]|uniref:anti-sigma factor n=1 Tax=Priestia koreensis TaxID=284581 RepID=UPI001F58BC24|nr:anti-sigma factor [Priestia koreensis]MCM3006460.1 anti-sigma factor [Priestia koreensis]UNL87304.1 anti-sigma factor [Priestia koreensis]